MAYGSISLEKRIKDNIKNYSLGQLLDMAVIQKQLDHTAMLTGVEVLITRRHGEPVIIVGEWPQQTVDVIADPGKKLKVMGRTIGHVYYRLKEENKKAEDFLDVLMESWEEWAESTYLYKETDQYVSELQFQTEEELKRKKEGNKLDALTGTLTHTYFRSRMKVLDRSKTAPIAAICVNINDWKVVNDNYGDEESDRLIQIVATILMEEGKPEYVIGRVDGDVFNVMIPMPYEGEAENYASHIQERCNAYIDSHLTPSIAVGIAVKENVEEELPQVFSDAEYEMLENKMKIKNSEEYQKRLRKNLQP